MAGSAPGNSTSTTGPTTWTIMPVFIRSAPRADLQVGLSLRRRSAGDLEQLLRDVSLPQLVVFEPQLPDHLGRTVGRPLHRHHPRALFARLRVQQDDVDEHVDVVADR